MRKVIFCEKFSVGNTDYTFDVFQNALPTVFFYISGGYHYARDEFGHEEDNTRLLGGTNAFKVLREVKTLLLRYIFEFKPHAFCFSAEDSLKRRRVYERLVNRYISKTPYTMLTQGSAMYFYRKCDTL